MVAAPGTPSLWPRPRRSAWAVGVASSVEGTQEGLEAQEFGGSLPASQTSVMKTNENCYHGYRFPSEIIGPGAYQGEK